MTMWHYNKMPIVQRCYQSLDLNQDFFDTIEFLSVSVSFVVITAIIAVILFFLM